MKKIDRINREELLGKISLSLDDLEKVTGGKASETLLQCADSVYSNMEACIAQCGNRDDNCEYDCELAAEAAAILCFVP